MFYIISFFFIFSLNASFEQKVAAVCEKPWLVHRLITKNELLQNLQNGKEHLKNVIDYKVFGKDLWYIARTEGGVDNRGVVGQYDEESICSGYQVNGPLLLNPQMHLVNKKVYDKNNYTLSECLTIPFEVKAAVQLGYRIFFIDQYGYLFESFCDQTTKQYNMPHRCLEYEPGNWLQTRFIDCFRSRSGASLFLETIDGRILEKQIPELHSRNLDRDDFYPRVFRTKEQLEEEIRTEKCEEVDLADFVKREETIPFYHTMPDIGLRFWLKFSKSSFQQSILWITLCGGILFLTKSRLLKFISLLVTIGALLASNRKFFFDFIEKNQGKIRY